MSHNKVRSIAIFALIDTSNVFFHMSDQTSTTGYHVYVILLQNDFLLVH